MAAVMAAWPRRRQCGGGGGDCERPAGSRRAFYRGVGAQIMRARVGEPHAGLVQGQVEVDSRPTRANLHVCVCAQGVSTHAMAHAPTAPLLTCEAAGVPPCISDVLVPFVIKLIALGSCIIARCMLGRIAARAFVSQGITCLSEAPGKLLRRGVGLRSAATAQWRGAFASKHNLGT